LRREAASIATASGPWTTAAAERTGAVAAAAGASSSRASGSQTRLLETSIAQEVRTCGWNQEARGRITRPGHRAHEVTAGTGEYLLKYQPSTEAQHAPLLGHESSLVGKFMLAFCVQTT
jgi:hypothetical protein